MRSYSYNYLVLRLFPLVEERPWSELISGRGNRGVCLLRLENATSYVKGYEQQNILLLHLKEHEKISRLAV